MLNKLRNAFKSAYFLFSAMPDLRLDEQYEEYWKEKRPEGLGAITPFQKERASWILNYIEPDSSLLDIGCGDGGVLLYLRSEVENLDCTAVDYSADALKFLEKQGLQTRTVDLNDLESVEALPDADYIVLFEILEHLQYSEKVLLGLTRKAKKGVFFSIPNSGYFPYRLRLLSGRFLMQWRMQPNEHLRFWTYKDLKWWLGQLGLRRDATIHLYEGIPLLNSLWKSMFAMGMVVFVRTSGE
ncbi:Methionine biosynthesis protein MetW [Stieleria maiorica]|uniref:Methionine biosynthesis protein MetW n=1 Tax=Stieleria maiorica TaxID=2795974 RepID=A0A5B9MI99_9BACT|nr:class I SAM-dependent methyltransferase [Stieleria maiorica]QEF98727.1 Methionine biosynthesis protein MetW [Stieleria maiorica]